MLLLNFSYNVIPNTKSNRKIFLKKVIMLFPFHETAYWDEVGAPFLAWSKKMLVNPKIFIYLGEKLKFLSHS